MSAASVFASNPNADAGAAGSSATSPIIVSLGSPPGSVSQFSPPSSGLAMDVASTAGGGGGGGGTGKALSSPPTSPPRRPSGMVIAITSTTSSLSALNNTSSTSASSSTSPVSRTSSIDSNLSPTHKKSTPSFAASLANSLSAFAIPSPKAPRDSSSSGSPPSSSSPTNASSTPSLFQRVSQAFSSSTSFSSTSPPLPSITYYTPAIVATHASQSDCWVIVSGRVFNVTDYLNLHPGGFRLLYRSAGKDATQDFIAIRHSKKAEAILYQHWIGDLEGTKPFKKVPENLGVALKKKESLSLVDPPEREDAIGGKLKGKERGSITVKEKTNLVNGTGFAINLIPPSSPTASSTSSLSASSPTSDTAAAAAASSGSGVAEMEDEEETAPFYDYRLDSVIEVAHSNFLLLFTSIANTTSSSASPPSSSSSSSTSNPSTSTTAAGPAPLLPFHLPIGHHLRFKHLSSTHTPSSLYRSYTPISYSDTTLTFIIKRYPEGRVSRYLTELNLGEIIRFYGSFGTYQYKKNAYDKVICICMGTGITPIYQLMKKWLGGDAKKRKDEQQLQQQQQQQQQQQGFEQEKEEGGGGDEDKTEVELIYGVRKKEEILLQEEMNNWIRRSPTRIKIRYCITNLPPSSTVSSASSELSSSSSSVVFSQGRINREILGQSVNSLLKDGRVRFSCLVSGSVDFNEEIKDQLVELGVGADLIHLF